MSERNLEFAQHWLEKARNDLFTARHVLDAQDGPTDTPCFHAQQAVEKVLKAILTASGVRFQPVHDLMPLLEQAASRVPELERFREMCAQLSDYAVAVRYPGEADDPAREEAAEAVDAAQEILAIGEDCLAGMA